LLTISSSNHHDLLHEAYETVKKANFEDIAKINKSLKKNIPA